MAVLPWVVVWGGWLGAGMLASLPVLGWSMPGRSLAREIRRQRREHLGAWGPPTESAHIASGRTVVVDGVVQAEDLVQTPYGPAAAISREVEPSMGPVQRRHRCARRLWVTTDDGQCFELSDAVRVQFGSDVDFAICPADARGGFPFPYDRYDRTIRPGARVRVRGVLRPPTSLAPDQWRLYGIDGAPIELAARGRFTVRTPRATKASRAFLATLIGSLLMLFAGQECLSMRPRVEVDASSDAAAPIVWVDRASALALVSPFTRRRALDRLALPTQ